VVIPFHWSFPRCVRHRASHPIDLDSRVVHLPQGIRISVLDVDVATLFADDIEQRSTSERVRLTHDAEVAGGDIAHATLVDLERSPCGLILRECSSNLLSHYQLRELKSPFGRLRLRRRRGDVALITVAYWQHDAHTGAEVMEDVLNWTSAARAGDAVEIKTHVLTLIADVDAGVPSPFGLLLANFRCPH